MNQARLIDAHELFEKAFEIWGVEAGEDETNVFMELINNCPTVDPVRHEYWIGFDTTTYTGRDDFGEPRYSPRRFYRCHGCRNGSVVKSNYCPACGAKMDAKAPWEQDVQIDATKKDQDTGA